MTWILASDWLRKITWPEYWLLIGWGWICMVWACSPLLQECGPHTGPILSSHGPIRGQHGSPKTTKYEYEYYSAFQKWPNTNTNIIGLSKNTNNIFFVLAQQCNIRGAFIHFSFWALKPVKAHYCAQRQNIKEYKRTIYFQKVQTGCIFYWSPPKTFQVLWSGW